MTAYWLLFLSASFLAVIASNRVFTTNNTAELYRINSLWWTIIAMLSIIIGLRHEVGGDWSGYLQIFTWIDEGEYLNSTMSAMMDPGYLLLNIVASNLGIGIHGVNFIAAAVFSIGLGVFCRQLPRPLLALAIAIPYLTIVVAMGYSRQSIALGLSMIAFTHLRNDKIWKFCILILIACTFHKTAVILIPLLIASQATNRAAIIFWGIFSAPILYSLLLSDSLGFLLEHYIMNIEEGFQSQGALIRVGMNVVPAVIFLCYSRRFIINQSDYNWLTLFSWATILCLVGLLLTEASAAIDRLALYLLPLQLLVFSYLPDAFTKDKALKQLIILGIIFYYGCVLFVWLNFGKHSQEWLPYQTILFN
ncbi:EpsG family protein [Gammaproteobacteria bacterium]|nr:EpsG family protein [Gammaproteobacteria bacterium]